MVETDVLKLGARIDFKDLVGDVEKAAKQTAKVFNTEMGKWFSSGGGITKKIEEHMKKEAAIGGATKDIMAQFPGMKKGAATGFARDSIEEKERANRPIIQKLTDMGFSLFAIREGFSTLKGVMNTMASSSPIMAANMAAFRKTFELIMLPISDIFGMFLRPLAIALLQFVIPWFKRYSELRGSGKGAIGSLAQATLESTGMTGLAMATGAYYGAKLGYMAGGPLGLGIGALAGAGLAYGGLQYAAHQGSYAAGGEIPRTGMYMLHGGEKITPAGSNDMMYAPNYNVVIQGNADEYVMRRALDQINEGQFGEFKRRL